MISVSERPGINFISKNKGISYDAYGPRFYCNVCQVRLTWLSGDKEWMCPTCGTRYGKDPNAPIEKGPRPQKKKLTSVFGKKGEYGEHFQKPAVYQNKKLARNTKVLEHRLGIIDNPEVGLEDADDAALLARNATIINKWSTGE